jgi:hypothetical protein
MGNNAIIHASNTLMETWKFQLYSLASLRKGEQATAYSMIGRDTEDMLVVILPPLPTDQRLPVYRAARFIHMLYCFRSYYGSTKLIESHGERIAGLEIINYSCFRLSVSEI